MRHLAKPVACLTGVARARFLVPAAGSTPERIAGGDASSAANTRSNGKRRRGLPGSIGKGVEAAVDHEHSPSPINGCIATSGRAHDLWNGGPFAGLVRPTMGTTRHPEQELQVVGLNSDTLPPSPEQDVCMRALTEVIRSRSLNARDKVRQLEVLCLQPEGSLLRRCLDGNGWNSKRNRREGYPSWPEAVHRLTIVLNALANKEPVPTHFEEQVVPPLVLFLVKKKIFLLFPTGTDTGAPRARAPDPYCCARARLRQRYASIIFDALRNFVVDLAQLLVKLWYLPLPPCGEKKFRHRAWCTWQPTGTTPTRHARAWRVPLCGCVQW